MILSATLFCRKFSQLQLSLFTFLKLNPKRKTTMKKLLTFLLATSLLASVAWADDCKNRGTLDEHVCIENKITLNQTKRLINDISCQL